MKVIYRMRCGKDHRKLFAIPDGYRIDWGGLCPWIVSVDGSQPALRCTEPGCRRQMRAFRVEGRYSDRIACNEKCVSAIGPKCECSCEGVNHGV